MNISADELTSAAAPARGDEARWAAVVARDATADGQFYYSVRTTGVYCRPSCKARPALRKNVGFHKSCAEAEQAGFRACKRCKPNSGLAAGPVADQTSIRFAVGPCSLGSVLMATTAKGICAILLGDDSQNLLDDLHGRFPHAIITRAAADLRTPLANVIRLIEAPKGGLDWPLDIQGTAFQRRVWQALREIPPGSTVSYADVARRLGTPKAVRAVARACAGNRIAVAIACHRVVRSDGALSGYRWGAARKQALLAREATV